MKRMQLVLLITALMLVGTLAVPAYAANITISGTIPFDPNNYNNVSSPSLLTIYAMNDTGFQRQGNPNADGTFTIVVTQSGKYDIRVIPAQLDYLNKSTNATYSILYPGPSTFAFNLTVPDQGLGNVTIPTKTVITGPSMSVTPLPPSVPPATPTPTSTPKPTPGFTAIIALMALGAIVVIAYKKK